MRVNVELRDVQGSPWPRDLACFRAAADDLGVAERSHSMQSSVPGQLLENSASNPCRLKLRWLAEATSIEMFSREAIVFFAGERHMIDELYKVLTTFTAESQKAALTKVAEIPLNPNSGIVPLDESFINLLSIE